jgi:hypothetical protein
MMLIAYSKRADFGTSQMAWHAKPFNQVRRKNLVSGNPPSEEQTDEPIMSNYSRPIDRQQFFAKRSKGR